MSARSLAEEFFARMQAGDVDGILGMMTPEAAVSLVPLSRHGPVAADGAWYLRELSRAFPDLLVRVRRLFVTGDDTAVAEITIDGTQADAFLAVANQEKHFDLDQALDADGHAGRPDQCRHRVLGPEPALPPPRRQTARQDHDHGGVR